MNTTKKYWRSVEHLNEDPGFMEQAHKEFAEPIPVEEFLNKTPLDETSTSRRDFLKFLGFSVTAATLAACETPVTRSIPYVVKPEEITPGVANYYATSFADGNDYASILVKTREGRPIHIEGNKMSGVTSGGLNARVNSSVLSLYDTKRLQHPTAASKKTTWAELDAAVMQKLDAAAASGAQVRMLTNSIISPSTSQLIGEFGAKFGGVAASSEEGTEETASSSNFKHVTYDSLSNAGILKANKRDFGKAVIPSYRFDQAKVIVSIGADFLSTWLSSIEYAGQYASRRKPGGDWMSKHFQFETTLSTTGSNADIRGAIKPSEHGKVAAMLLNAVAGSEVVKTGGLGDDDNDVKGKVAKAAADLVKAKGASLVVAGSNDPNVQTLVNAINDILGNIGTTVDLDAALYLRQGKDEEVAALLEEMSRGAVDTLIIYGGDPAYSMPSGWKFAEALGKVKNKISFSTKMDTTAKLCDYVAPDNHYLESWNDANPVAGQYSTIQPTINPLFKTRQAQNSMLKWMGKDADFHGYLQGTWEKYGFPFVQDQFASFTDYWNKSVHNGVGAIPVEKSEYTFAGDTAAAAKGVNAPKAGEMELELYVKTGIGDGIQADNPWLQELPDPVTRVVWDNYITMNPAEMKGIYETNTAEQTPADMATVTVGDANITLPVVAVPGQKMGTIGIALGYGKSTVDGAEVGKNAFGLLGYNGTTGTVQYSNYNVTVAPANEKYPIASTQTHHTMMGRKIVNETNLETFDKDKGEGDLKPMWNEDVFVKDAYGKKQKPANLNLWEDFDIDKGHRWGMAIDLNSCIGCGACVTACHSENNVPVVGKDEVRRTRTMSWMRIDRYYSSDADPKGFGVGEDRNYTEMEVPSKYPDVAFQPLMCQHCNHAPCETVCPVAATTHSEEGLNQMAYNRCVGTRYCANNCPFKVRRFNWFNYVGYKKFKDVNPAQNDLSRMVLNPDVVVRSRGVMEKCSMCVQRIQAGKLDAKKNSAPVQDGAISTACSSACPTHAITFGDINSESQVRSEAQDNRAYNILEELGVQPNIWYMTKVRNRTVAEDGPSMPSVESHEA